METKNILVPFVGFYESTASMKAEDIAFHNFVSENNIVENKDGRMDIPDDLEEKIQEKFWDEYYPKNIKDIREQIAKDYIEHLGNEIGITMQFESIDSPKQYNYTTDRLFVDVPKNELIDLYNRTDKKILEEMIKERHTSGPGFDSFYQNEITDPSWQDPEQFDHNQWQTVIEAKAKQDEVDLEELYYI
jgi:hypothetical protein